MTGFTFLSRLTQIAPPPTRFVFLGAGIRLGLPSHPASRRRSCLRLGVSITSSSRGLSPPSDRPCRAYSRRRLRRRWPGAGAGLWPWEAPAGARRAARASITDRASSFAAQTGAAGSRLPRAPSVRSRLSCQGRPADVACDQPHRTRRPLAREYHACQKGPGLPGHATLARPVSPRQPGRGRRG